MEKIEENKVEEQKKHNKWKVNWFDWIAFLYVWLLLTILPLSSKIDKTLKSNIHIDTNFKEKAVFIWLAIMLLNFVSVAIIAAFGLKNNELIKKTRMFIFINKKPFITQLYIIGIIFSYILIIKFLNLLFESIF